MVAAIRHDERPLTTREDQRLDVSVGALRPIGLAELGAGNLQDRVDTKFLFSASVLPSLLDALSDDYRVLEIDGVRAQRYQTLYFDTPDFALYRAQHSGRPNRYKVRTRCYIETRQAFLEVKHKNRRSRTIKNRVATDAFLTELDVAATDFVGGHVPFSVARLEAKLWNLFTRITLAAADACERVTLDIDLAFGCGAISAGFAGLVVAELKQDGRNRNSRFRHEMRRRNIHPTGFSKYCIGAAVLNDELKHNRFKPELLRAQRLSERDVDR